MGAFAGILLGILIPVLVYMFDEIKKTKRKIKHMEQILKSMNHDLNMVSKTMQNQKQLLKG